MASKVEIFNFALANIGNSVVVENPDERTKEANVCNLFYDEVLKLTLRDHHWPFARTFASLQLIESDPTTEWAYSYGYPGDCMKFRRILSGARNDTRASRVPYIIVHAANQKRIYTDVETPVAEYTMLVTDTNLFPPDFTSALSWRLSAHIAPALGGESGLKVRSDALLVYGSELDTARSNALNEEQPEEEPDSAIVQSRL